MEVLTVAGLIELLKTFDGELPVAYELYSEYRMLDANDIRVRNLQPHRQDGWVHSVWHGKPELPTIEYLVFPGN